jgi:predicted MFS family arabinose efflux permease
LTYIQELRANWRPLLGATIAMSCGFVAVSFTNNIMGPHLMQEFGWSKAKFALIGTLGFMTLVALPVSGRLADLLGVRRTALIGFLAATVTFLLMSRMGSFTGYVALLMVQDLLCMTTTTTVLARTVVQHFSQARGLALAIAASGPALTIAIAGPLLNNFVTAHGWRVGYVALSAFCLVGGLIALSLIPPNKPRTQQARAARNAKRDYGMLVRMPAFWVLIGGIVLCHLSQFITNSQLSVVLMENGVSPAGISGMISIFAIGVLIGRFACGIALDRLPAPPVAAIVMAAPAIALFLIASKFDTPAVLMTAVLFRGLAFGAEGDLIGYLVAKIFGIEIFGTVMGVVVATITLGSTAGAVVLSLTLKVTDNYNLFFVIAGALALIGSLFFLRLPNQRPPQEEDRRDAAAATSPSGG